MDDTSGPEKNGERKTRRSHRKSRNGCSKCKERRIKCDELTPRCSRCAKMDLPCLYPTPKRNLRVDGTSPSLSPKSTWSLSPSPVLYTSPLHSPLAQSLSPQEFSLFSHYLEHTSRDPTVDEFDQYTLQIGIPNLACEHGDKHNPLMRSILAFAAVCQCRDLISSFSSSPTHHLAPGLGLGLGLGNVNVDVDVEGLRGKVMAMAALADQYHLESLRETQKSLNETTGYDAVLANAAIMGMYGSGSYVVRLWLARHMQGNLHGMEEEMPKHPAWIGLYRAVDLAYAALWNDLPEEEEVTPGLGVSPRESQSQREKRGFQHPLLGIFAATMPSALQQLRRRVEEVMMMHGTETETEMDMCLKALALLEEVAGETFAGYYGTNQNSNDSSGNTESSGGRPGRNPNRILRPGSSPPRTSPQFGVNLDRCHPHPRLSAIAPWLRRYTASITSAVPSRLPRRTIVRFIHRVDGGYHKLVEEGMVRLLSAYPTYSSPEVVSGDGIDGRLSEDASMPGLDDSCINGLDDTHQLALDIFAHWLVLVMLLDQVWWIGEIGCWELGRIIVAARAAGLWREGDWWPESMWEVGRQFEKHRG